MIVDAIFDALSFLIGGFFDLLPDWSLPSALSASSMSGYASTVRGWLGPVAYWVPFSLMFTIAALVISLKFTLRAFQLVLFVRRLFP